jgi:hypothetical protein
MVMKIFPKGQKTSKVCRYLVTGVFTLPISYDILIQSTYYQYKVLNIQIFKKQKNIIKYL